MPDTPDPEKLRQIAEHRGLKLLKSRRRKPGAGDYGKFGLADAAGRTLLGAGDEGLTASAQDVAAYLRAGTLGSWRESADTTPDRPAPIPKEAPAEKAKVATVAPRTRGKTSPPIPKPVPKHEPKPEPQLVIRSARPTDADAIAKLVNHLSSTAVDRKTAKQNLAAIAKVGGGLLLAELGKPIGCCGWTVVHTIQHGQIGRITILFVAADHRRRGIARQLLAVAEQSLADAGCTIVEAMSDIEFNNAHNFFRALAFEQSSYRFTRKLVV